MNLAIKPKSLIVLLFSVCIFSCKKNELTIEKVQDDGAALRSVEWIKTQHKVYKHPAIKAAFLEIAENIEASNLQTKKLLNNENLIIIPLKASFQTPVETTRFSQKNLVLVESAEHQIRYGNIVEIVQKERFSNTASMEFIAKMYNNDKSDLTGIAIFLSMTNRFLHEKEFRQGELSSIRFLVNRNKDLPSEGIDQSGWQLITVDYLNKKNNITRTNLFADNAGRENIIRMMDDNKFFRLTGGLQRNVISSNNLSSGDTWVEDYSFLDEPGDEPDGYAPPIIYSYHATIGRIDGEVVEVIMDPTTAHPTQSNYINAGGQDVQRNLTVFNHYNTWVPLGGPNVLLDWQCDVHALYLYWDGTPPRTRQWHNTKMSVK
ncbi:hypothetical protein [Pseudobacter ginsenosidimutans]|uniref:Uncharacterized protein n=1 Tax=Pseudobacter ginsenosidimutans TaxID=661488 RepID=A0A4Q7MY39_9BACT|nr:hypothetical protein [Pseudobacter ginsenosidimutans]QEC41108.1 hypothetical protein FSB84_05140 [Pseudobacter ginsenosidimutans]RZS72133.1 hypothetical protein EV199_4048 [Pseudobacter ginsenosidimutans]